MKHLKKFNEEIGPIRMDDEERAEYEKGRSNINTEDIESKSNPWKGKLFYDLPKSFTIDDLRKAYTDGQNSVQVKMKQKESYDEYGDMVVKLVGEKEITKKFEDWVEENWD